MIDLRSKSIRVRLTAAYSAVLALTFALMGIGLWIGLEHSIQETADRELRIRLADVRHYIDGFSPADLTHLEEEFREESLLSQSVANVRISDQHGKWLFRTPSTNRWPEQRLSGTALAPDGTITTLRIRHQLIRIITGPVRVGVVQIGLSIDELEEVKTGFLWTIGLGSPIILLLASLGGYWISGRTLQPVADISNAAARISARDLSARLPASGVGDELDRLSIVLNDMLARLESSFNRIVEFTADASHELRTPVAVIQTTAELMQARARTPEEHLRAWASVSAETARTADLIGDLLTLARADAGKSSLEFHPIDLCEIAKAACAEMAVLAAAKHLRINLDAPGDCRINGDADALRRAVCILLDNAIKFSCGPGEIHVAVKNGAGASISVADTGTGIAPEDLPMIFERFYRVSKDRSRKTGGAGLGLSIARWIAKQHGGNIKAESQLAKGSTFTLLLPGQL